MKRILGILGATGVGKSQLAVLLGKHFETSVISADSMQIYKGMDIGTAKITTEEMQGVKHYMIDIVEPSCNFSAFDFKEQVDSLLTSDNFKNKVPVIAGGTGLYFNTLLYGLDFPSNETTLKIRQEMTELYNQQGISALLDILQQKDHVTFDKIDKNNVKRIIRAIEIAEMGYSQYGDCNKTRIPLYDSKLFALTRNREAIYDNINRRVDKMIAYGLVDEVKSLMETYPNYSEMQAFKAIGYKEIISALKGEQSIAEAIEQIKLNTRHYAKRQLTYFKRLPVNWVDMDSFSNIDDVAEFIIKELEHNDSACV